MVEGESEKMTGSRTAGIAADEGNTFLWSELPKDAQHKVLSNLPIEDLCQLRCVCKEWRDVIHRRDFCSMYDMVNSSQEPSPAICYTESTSYPVRLEWSSYDYAGRMWKKKSSFPSPPQSSLTALNARNHSLHSVGGLMCLYRWEFPLDYECPNVSDSPPCGVSLWTVWHPFRNRWKQLPPCKNKVGGIARAPFFVHVFVSDEARQTYKILMAHDPDNQTHDPVNHLVTTTFQDHDDDHNEVDVHYDYRGNFHDDNHDQDNIQREDQDNDQEDFQDYVQGDVQDDVIQRLVTEIYDSATGMWTDGAEYTLEFDERYQAWPFKTGDLHRRGVLCNGVIYFVTGGFCSPSVLLFYDIRSDKWDEEKYNLGYLYPVLEWDGRLMTIKTEAEDEGWTCRMPKTHSFFSEWDTATRTWIQDTIEIPHEIIDTFQEMDCNIEIVASGNHLALIADYSVDGRYSIPTAVYHRAENHWSLVPPRGPKPARIQGLILHTPSLNWSP